MNRVNRHLLALLLAALPLAATAQNNTVFLDDREPHTWSYYSDPASPVRSLNPADVKITYFAYGTNTMYSSNASTPSGNPDVSVAASQVGIGIDAPEKNTYVYHKTLERVNGEENAATSDLCKYTTIPNPFSIRPTYGSGTTRWRGFYKWRIKALNGGSIYADEERLQPVAQGAMVDAEQDLYFAPASSTGMTVELEAIWARAYVFGSTSNLNSAYSGNYATGANAYERNFVVLTGATTGMAANRGRGATITSIYPNGTNGSNATLLTGAPTSVYISQNFHCEGDTKFEYVNFYAYSYIFSASPSTSGTNQTFKNRLVMGRGIQNPWDDNPCLRAIAGYCIANNTAPSSEVDVKLRIESGTYQLAWFLGLTNSRNYPVTQLVTNNDAAACNVSVLASTHVVLGSDYDRSTGNNELLSISGTMYGARWQVFTNAGCLGSKMFNYCIKSGRFFTGNVGNAKGNESVYLGTIATEYGTGRIGCRTLVMEGGIVSSIAGGMDSDDEGITPEHRQVDLRIKGGTIRGCLYGASMHSYANGSRRMVITGGDIHGWLAGGSNGTDVILADMRGNTYIYFGGRARLEYTADDPKIASSYGGNLYGAGSGNEEATGDVTPGRVRNSTVVIADSCLISRNVYGGGNYGYITDRGSNICILGGTIKGKVFGGANQQTGKMVDIVMRGGHVHGGVYGGSNLLGRVEGPVCVRIENGTVGTPDCHDSIGNVFGSGYGEETSVEGDVQVVIGHEDAKHPHSTLPRIHGNIYGGGHNAPYRSTGKDFSVTTWNGLVDKHVFGGGYGTSAVITGDTRVNILGTTHVGGNVYGGGNLGRVKGNTRVQIGD